MRVRGYLVGVVSLLVVWLGSTANAQITKAKGDFFVTTTVGAAIPAVNFSDWADVGGYVGATMDYMVTDNTAIGADVVADFFGKTEGIGEDAVDEFRYTIMRFGGHGKYLFAPNATVDPFIFGGLGIYNIRLKVSSRGDRTESNSGIGANVGGGLMLEATKTIDLTVQATFHNVFIGSSAQYVDVGGGLIFRLGSR